MSMVQPIENLRRRAGSRFIGTCALAILAQLVVLPVAAQQLPMLRDTALIEAARIGDIASLRAAHANGQSVRAMGRNGQTALHVASQWGQPEAVAALLQMGAPPDKRAGDGHTALSYAVSFGHTTIVEQLLKAGADVDRPGPNYEPPLVMAARLGRADISAKILAANPMLDETDSTGRTAMDWARNARHPKIVAQLQAALQGAQ